MNTKRVKTATNTGLAKLAVQCSANAFVLNQHWFSASTFVVKIAAFAKLQNGEGEIMILACADCTGHGVPGAFMSMIGNEILTNIVEIQGITSPDLILNELHKKIRTALKQGETENRDGMDISWGRPRGLGQRRLGQRRLGQRRLGQRRLGQRRLGQQ